MSVDDNLVREALALLRARGYVCLTSDEAEKLRVGITALADLAWVSYNSDPWYAAAKEGQDVALALLSAKGSDEE